MMVLVHELRSPVAASKSLVAALRYTHDEDSRLDANLVRIEKRMEQLLDLVDDIFCLSHVKARQFMGEAVVCDLSAKTQAASEAYIDEAEAKGLSMTVDLPQSPVAARIVVRAYELILSNLLSNAVKYTPSGWVRVTLRQRGRWAVLEIRDSGIGIPGDEIPQLCKEFYRASNARAEPVRGTGLGLASVRALVERCGGKLELESQECEGSRFTVRLSLDGPDNGASDLWPLAGWGSYSLPSG
jgi:signal transduction histidine kinase